MCHITSRVTLSPMSSVARDQGYLGTHRTLEIMSPHALIHKTDPGREHGALELSTKFREFFTIFGEDKIGFFTLQVKLKWELCRCRQALVGPSQNIMETFAKFNGQLYWAPPYTNHQAAEYTNYIWCKLKVWLWCTCVHWAGRWAAAAVRLVAISPLLPPWRISQQAAAAQTNIQSYDDVRTLHTTLLLTLGLHLGT